MASVVYAVFDSDVSAEAATAKLSAHSDAHPAFAVQSHGHGLLDGDDMPEAATEIGRNTVVAVLAGAVIGLVIGLVAGSTLDVLGLSPGLGAAFGLLTGALSGMLGGMMAGTRTPKRALRETAAELEPGELLLTVEVLDPGHIELVETLLEQQGAALVDHC